MKKLITTFTAERKDYGLQVKVAGCKELQPPLNMPKDVIGTVRLNDQLVPILSNCESAQNIELTEQSCIVLFENTISDTTIFTGKLYDNSDDVYDLITQFMDCPEEKAYQFLHSDHEKLTITDKTPV